jgi:hypothetical protein
MTDDGGEQSESDDEQAESLAELDQREGWRVEGRAARVHYKGATDRYSIEFYAPSECLIYWKVPPAESTHETAVPVGRDTVPTPLRERIREDLAAAGLDPDLERQSL